MKSQLLPQLALIGLLSLSMVACQKSNDSAPAQAEAVQPTPTETTVETKPKTALEQKNEAETQLQTIGLKFAEPPEIDDADLFLIEAKWDIPFYKEFLQKAETKPTLEAQIEILKNYCAAVDMYLQTNLAIDPHDLENESGEELALLAEKTLNEARLALAQTRLSKLEKRLEMRQKKEAEQKASEPAPKEEPKTEEPKVDKD